MAKNKPTIKITNRDLLLYFFISVFLIASIASSLRSPDIKAAIFGTISYILIFVFLFYVINNEVNNNNFESLMKLLAVGWILFLVYNLAIITAPNYWHGKRFISFYGKSGPFGFNIAILFPLILYFCLSKKYRKLARIFFFFGLLLSLFFLFISGSRGGYVALILSTLLFLFLAYKVSIKAVLVTLLLVLLVCGIYDQYSKDFSRNVVNRFFSEENIDSRISQYKTVIEILPKLIVIGYGLNNGDVIMDKYGSRNRPHNLFLGLLLEVGVLGVFALIGILVLSVTKSFGLLLFKRKKIRNLYIYSAVFSSCISFLVLAQFMTPSVHRAYWLLVALSYHLPTLIKNE